MKKKELQNRERMLQCNEQTANDLEADDINEYLLQEKVKDLTLKVCCLKVEKGRLKVKKAR